MGSSLGNHPNTDYLMRGSLRRALYDLSGLRGRAGRPVRHTWSTHISHHTGITQHIHIPHHITCMHSHMHTHVQTCTQFTHINTFHIHSCAQRSHRHSHTHKLHTFSCKLIPHTHTHAPTSFLVLSKNPSVQGSPRLLAQHGTAFSS